MGCKESSYSSLTSLKVSLSFMMVLWFRFESPLIQKLDADLNIYRCEDTKLKCNTIIRPKCNTFLKLKCSTLQEPKCIDYLIFYILSSWFYIWVWLFFRFGFRFEFSENSDRSCCYLLLCVAMLCFVSMCYEKMQNVQDFHIDLSLLDR